MEAQQARARLVQDVKNDVRKVLSESWEMRQVLHTAPKASSAAVRRMSQPHGQHAGSVCDFARRKAAQLSKQRRRYELAKQELNAYEAAQTEALQGWLRLREQEKHQQELQYLENLAEQQAKARMCAHQVTQQAKADLQALKEQHEQQLQQQAALARLGPTMWKHPWSH